MGLSDAVNDWKDLISNIPTQYYAVFSEKYNFFVLGMLILLRRNRLLGLQTSLLTQYLKAHFAQLG